MANSWLAGLSGALGGYNQIVQGQAQERRDERKEDAKWERQLALEDLRAKNNTANRDAGYAQQEKMFGMQQDALTERTAGNREYQEGQRKQGILDQENKRQSDFDFKVDNAERAAKAEGSATFAKAVTMGESKHALWAEKHPDATPAQIEANYNSSVFGEKKKTLTSAEIIDYKKLWYKDMDEDQRDSFKAQAQEALGIEGGISDKLALDMFMVGIKEQGGTNTEYGKSELDTAVQGNVDMALKRIKDGETIEAVSKELAEKSPQALSALEEVITRGESSGGEMMPRIRATEKSVISRFTDPTNTIYSGEAKKKNRFPLTSAFTQERG